MRVPDIGDEFEQTKDFTDSGLGFGVQFIFGAESKNLIEIDFVDYPSLDKVPTEPINLSYGRRF